MPELGGRVVDGHAESSDHVDMLNMDVTNSIQALTNELNPIGSEDRCGCV